MVADQQIQVPPNCELTLGMTCVDKVEPGTDRSGRMRADERFANPAGIVQGGFIGAMADSAMGSATVTYARAAGRRVVSSNVEMKASFLAPVRVGATARLHGFGGLGRAPGGLRRGRGGRRTEEGSWPGPARPTCSPSAT